MTFVLLGLAIVVEVIGTSLLRSTEGFTRLLPSVACLTAYLVAIVLLALIVRRGLEVGVVYALWSGLGTTLVVVIGTLVLREPLTWAKVVGVGLIVAGVVTLNFGGLSHGG